MVAEEVAKVDPDLVVADDKGKPFTVRYEEVNAMLLNEFLKEHREVGKLERAMAEQKTEFQAALAQQQTKQQQEIAVLTKTLKEQAGQIQKVSAQVQLNTAAPRVVANAR